MKYLLSIAVVAVALCTSTPSNAQSLLTWDSPVNVTAAAGALTKSGGCDLCPDAGAHSRGQITADGYAEFVVGSVARLSAGLNTDVSPSTDASMDYAFKEFRGDASLLASATPEVLEIGCI